MNLFQRLRLFIDKHALRGAKATWGLFLLYAFVIFITVIVSHWFFFHSLYISSLWKNPSVFFTFWLPKITISLFLSSFILFTKRKWWTFVVLIIICLWIIANIIYFRANNEYITWECIMIADNLSGFESSIGFYWNYQCTFFVILSCLYGLCLPFFQNQTIGNIKYIIVAIVILLHLTGAELYRSMMKRLSNMPWSYLNNIPFYQEIEIRYSPWSFEQDYRNYHSIIHTLPLIINGAIVDTYMEQSISISPIEKTRIQDFLHPIVTKMYPKYDIMFILVESLESWPLGVRDNSNQHILPNFTKLSTQDKVTYVDKLVSQARNGGSIDGQQIYMTGLLPTTKGAAAMIYGEHVYPNFAHFYDSSFLSVPTKSTVWNQDVVTYSYGFKTMLSDERTISDAETFNKIPLILSKCSQNSMSCYLAITESSHTPFNAVPHNPSLHLDANMPEEMYKYLTCLHYTDSCFGAWYNEWKDTDQAKNTVLVITGDHTIFKDAMLQEFKPYAQQAGLSIASGKTYCPLIIQAPQIKENIQITDVCYQMDVYPTIMHLIGCEDYYWKGFGVNLLDSTARHNRPITEEEAYQLSDKIIRADYFREIITSAESSAQ